MFFSTITSIQPLLKTGFLNLKNLIVFQVFHKIIYTMEKEKKWGGKRAGSGRKKTENSEDLITLNIKINKEHKDLLDKTSKIFNLLFGGGCNRNVYFEQLIENEFEYYKEQFFDEHREAFYKILNEQVDSFISRMFNSLSVYPIPYHNYSDLFNVRIKTNVEKEYISFIEKEYLQAQKEAFYSNSVKEAFNSLCYDEIDSSCKKKEIKETLRIIKVIEKKFDELFKLVYEDNFNYTEWLLDFKDFVSVESRSHIYDLE